MSGSPAGGTGDAPDSSAAAVPSGGLAGPAAAQPSGTFLVEHEGDLHEYGLSLGVDLDADAEEDLAWAVREAFNAPLLGGWTEYMDDSGRAYYIKDGCAESTWEHPMDAVYRELLDLIKATRQRHPPATAEEREEFVKQHLRQVHERAKKDLEGWSGPYTSEQGDYYYNDLLRVSSWDSPVAEKEKELALRHTVLSRYLLPEHLSGSGAAGASAGAAGAGGLASSHHMLQALRLQLGNLQASGGAFGAEGSVPEPSTSRSYHTARSSHCSSRSGRSKHHKERKERKERRADGHSGAASSAMAAPTPEGEEVGAYHAADALPPQPPFAG